MLMNLGALNTFKLSSTRIHHLCFLCQRFPGCEGRMIWLLYCPVWPMQQLVGVQWVSQGGVETGCAIVKTTWSSATSRMDVLWRILDHDSSVRQSAHLSVRLDTWRTSRLRRMIMNKKDDLEGCCSYLKEEAKSMFWSSVITCAFLFAHSVAARVFVDRILRLSISPLYL